MAGEIFKMRTVMSGLAQERAALGDTVPMVVASPFLPRRAPAPARPRPIKRRLVPRGSGIRLPANSRMHMDKLRRFPAPWVMKEDRDGFRVFDASGFFICAFTHREDLHRGARASFHGKRRGGLKAISLLP